MRRAFDLVLLADCVPAIAPVIAGIVVKEIATALRDLRRADRAGLWGAS
jgi:hypothetical protein